MAVSLLKPPNGGFRSETDVTLPFGSETFPNGYKYPFGCNGYYVTAVAVGQRQRLYSGVGMFMPAPPKAVKGAQPDQTR
jgi:hypothetical protein